MKDSIEAIRDELVLMAEHIHSMSPASKAQRLLELDIRLGLLDTAPAEINHYRARFGRGDVAVRLMVKNGDFCVTVYSTRNSALEYILVFPTLEQAERVFNALINTPPTIKQSWWQRLFSRNDHGNG